MPRGRDDMQVNVAGLRRNIKNLAHNYSDAQVKVREATSNDPWGPSSTLMAEIADLTYNVMAFTEIMQMIWKRLNDHGKNWRHVYKALVLMEYLIKTGSEKVAMQCKENIFAIQTLKDFQYMEEGKDQGLNVREKAKQLVILLKDDERLKNERARALKAKQRFAQSASAFGSDGALDTPTSPSYPALSSSAEWSGGAGGGSAGSGREAELARPLTAGEEELQLQLALAMSREEAEREERRRRSDDVRLQLAISQSQNDFQVKECLRQEFTSLPPITEETHPNNAITGPYSEHPYAKCKEQNATERAYNTSGSNNTNNWTYSTVKYTQNVSLYPQNVSEYAQNDSQYAQNISEYPQNGSDWPLNVNYTYIAAWTCEERNKTSDRSNTIHANNWPAITNDWSENTKALLQNTRDVTQSTKDVTQNSNNWSENTKDLTQYTKDMTETTKGVTQNTKDVTRNANSPQNGYEYPQNSLVHIINNCPCIPCEAVTCSELPSPKYWLCGCLPCILRENVQDPDESGARVPEPAPQSHLLDLLDVNLSPASAPAAAALPDPWAVPEHNQRTETSGDAWSGVSSPARDPWAPAAAPPDPWAPALAGVAQNKSPVSVISSPSSSELEQFDALSRRPLNNNIEPDNDPFDLTGLGDNLAKASSPLSSSTGAIKKSPSAFLGENSSLVNLERLLQPVPPALPLPAHNPFADTPAPAPAPAPRQFAPNQPAKLTINELKQQQMGLTGLTFPSSPATGPAPGMGMGMSAGMGMGAGMQADPWSAAPVRTSSPWSPQNQRHTPNPFLS